MSIPLKSTSNVINLQDAIVIRGQSDWAFLKKTASGHRQAWRGVGEALAYGRKLHPSNQAFGKWCVEQGFDDIHRNYRSAAIWLAQYWNAVVASNTCKGNDPIQLQKYFNKAIKHIPPTPDLTLIAPDRLVASVEQVGKQAKTINKLVAMAERGEGQEKVQAQKYLDKNAEAFGMETAELTELAGKLDPTIGLPIDSLQYLEGNIKSVVQLATNLAKFVKNTQTVPGSTPLTREMALFLVLETFTAQGI